jgi:Ca2+-binding RTX toxin-like protein
LFATIAQTGSSFNLHNSPGAMRTGNLANRFGVILHAPPNLLASLGEPFMNRTALSSAIQPLESRLMMYSFTLTSGTLRLTCDATSQGLSVSLSGSNIVATLSEGNTQITQQQWASSSVSQIFVVCSDGDDRVNVSNKIKIKTLIAGGAGNDTLIAGGGNDSLGGDVGDDILDGGAGADSMVGGPGNDTADYSSRTNNLVIKQDPIRGDGEAGEDDFVNSDIETLQGGSGNDLLQAGAVPTGINVVYGNDGIDRIFGMSGTDTLYGGSGDDWFDAGTENDVVYGGTGRDTMSGSDGNDTLDGGKGVDRIYGNRGNDRIYANDGYNDIIDGGKSTDRLYRDDGDRVFNIP